MLKPKKKISKREIKEDKLVTTYFEAQSWFEQNRKRLGTLATILVVVVAATWIYFNDRASSSLNATTDLGKVMRFYDQGQYQTAINGSPQENVRGLEQIVNDYGSTASGEIARLYLGNCYFSLAQYDRALELYRDTDIGEKSLMASVYAGIAACEAEKGNVAESARFYEKAASTDTQNLHTAEYLYRAAGNYVQAGEKEKASDLLERLKKDFPQSTYAREADRLSAQVRS
ncbi:MAG TPA: tetratricopeptide repeat protein [Bacteroidota bacterium]|nr:tetratricopeptide repeat protein [Bacteroidota bacterium]